MAATSANKYADATAMKLFRVGIDGKLLYIPEESEISCTVGDNIKLVYKLFDKDGKEIELSKNTTKAQSCLAQSIEEEENWVRLPDLVASTLANRKYIYEYTTPIFDTDTPTVHKIYYIPKPAAPAHIHASLQFRMIHFANAEMIPAEDDFVCICMNVEDMFHNLVDKLDELAIQSTRVYSQELHGLVPIIEAPANVDRFGPSFLVKFAKPNYIGHIHMEITFDELPAAVVRFHVRLRENEIICRRTGDRFEDEPPLPANFKVFRTAIGGERLEVPHETEVFFTAGDKIKFTYRLFGSDGNEIIFNKENYSLLVHSYDGSIIDVSSTATPGFLGELVVENRVVYRRTVVTSMSFVLKRSHATVKFDYKFYYTNKPDSPASIHVSLNLSFQYFLTMVEDVREELYGNDELVRIRVNVQDRFLNLVDELNELSIYSTRVYSPELPGLVPIIERPADYHRGSFLIKFATPGSIGHIHVQITYADLPTALVRFHIGLGEDEE